MWISQDSLWGDGLILMAALVWAVYTVAGKGLVDRYGPLRVTTWTLWVGTPGLVALGLPDLIAMDWGSVPASAWLGVAYAGFFGIGVAYLIWYAGVAVLGSSRTAIYSNTIPVVALLVAWAWLGEVPTLAQILGGGLVLLGVGVARAKRDARTRRPRLQRFLMLDLRELVENDAFIGHVRPNSKAVIHLDEDLLCRLEREVQLCGHIRHGECPAVGPGQTQDLAFHASHDGFAALLKGFPSPEERHGTTRADDATHGDRCCLEFHDPDQDHEGRHEDRSHADDPAPQAAPGKCVFGHSRHLGWSLLGEGRALGRATGTGGNQPTGILPCETAIGTNQPLPADEPVGETADAVREQAERGQNPEVTGSAEVLHSTAPVAAPWTPPDAGRARGCPNDRRTTGGTDDGLRPNFMSTVLAVHRVL